MFYCGCLYTKCLEFKSAISQNGSVGKNDEKLVFQMAAVWFKSAYENIKLCYSIQLYHILNVLVSAHFS